MAGAWLDTKSGKVVTEQPEEGVQLVSPNVEQTAADAEVIAAAEAAADAAAAAAAVPVKAPKPAKDAAPAPAVVDETPAPVESAP